MSDLEWTKICGVCGDKAIAKNFGAVSCESCKAFFRRNASKINVYKCYFDNNCKIDAITRKFCRRCRLRKCFEIGMKQEWILSDEQKQIRRKKIEDKKQVRKGSVHSMSASDSAIGSSPEAHDFDSVELFENNISDEEIITNIMKIETYIDCEQNDKNDDIADDVYQKAVELEFAVLPIARPIPPNNTTFNEMESNRLIELFSALTVFSETPKQNNSEMNGMSLINGIHNPNDLCAIMGQKLENDIKNLVVVSKNLSSFNNLCENDQISLLKYGFTEVSFMRSIVQINLQTNMWTITLDDKQSIMINIEVFKKGPCGMHDQYESFLKKMDSEWESDTMVLDLLTAVVLFNPERPNLIHKDMVKLQQQIYMYLLQRYLYLKYQSECQSKEKFLKLLNTLHDLHALQQASSKSRKEKNPQFFGPLVRECLDLEA